MAHEDKVLMVKASYKSEWTFPGGVIDEDESPQAAALRELAEEVGVALEPKDVTFLSVVYTPSGDGFKDRYSFAFYTDKVSIDSELTLQESEIEAAKWVPITEVAEYANGRGSYRIFQKLLEDGRNGTYMEVGGQ